MNQEINQESASPKRRAFLYHSRGVGILAVSLSTLIACVGLATAQSTDRDHPTPFTSNEVSGTVGPGDTGEYFYSFEAGPGEVKTTLDFKSEVSVPRVTVYVYNEDAQELLRLFGTAIAPASAREIKRVKLTQRQTLVMKVLREQSGGDAGTWRVRLEGAVNLAPPPAAAAATSPAAPPPSAAPAAQPAAPASSGLTVPSGTVVTVRMIAAIDSARDHAGQEFAATVDSPVLIGGRTAIPGNSDARVRLVQAKSAGHMAGKSELEVELVSITAWGTVYPVGSGVYELHGASRGKKTAETVAAGAALGGLIGGLAKKGKGAAVGAGAGAAAGAGIQAVTRGQQVKIPSETKIDFTLNAPVTVMMMSM